MRDSLVTVENPDGGMKITPLIDVIFILLIFFVLTLTIPQEKYLRIFMAEPSGVSPVPDRLEPYAIRLSLDADGHLQIRGGQRGAEMPLESLEDLQVHLITYRQLGEASAFSEATLYGTAQISWEVLARTLAICRKAGITKVGFAQIGHR